MSNYGVQIFLGNAEVDVVNSLSASYVLGVVNISTSSGRVSYDLPSGATLKYLPDTQSIGLPSITINGGTATWEGTSVSARLIFYCEY